MGINVNLSYFSGGVWPATVGKKVSFFATLIISGGNITWLMTPYCLMDIQGRVYPMKTVS